MTENSARMADVMAMFEARLGKLYPGQGADIAARIAERLERHSVPVTQPSPTRWDQGSVLLISYGDSIVANGRPPLETLHAFLRRHLADTFSAVHILPFYPYSSDDGFSVIDYRRVNDALGDWEDIARIANDFHLMVDLVINHVSRESLWFYDYVADRPPARDYFIELPQDTDTRQVTRPRNSPLLVPVNTHRGTRHLWATFSEDQIDVNFSNPDVLIEFIDIFLFYLARGARLIRLDAIAFLWKELGTSCVHLEQTHEIVKLLRDIFDLVRPDGILLTETNVPHKENISYFGAGDEAHMVYQFSLPPLVLHALNRGTAKYLSNWTAELPDPPEHCTFLNFTASHDGIGLRALEGLLPAYEVEDLIDCMHRFGGFVSMKANPDGDDSPYEINISYFDAMQGTRRGPDQWQVERFLCSQAIMLAMRGIPAVYIHSMLATPNDLHGVELSGRTRSINRKKWPHDELTALLDSHNTPNHEVFRELKRIIAIRRGEICFHPDSSQSVLDCGEGVFALLRERTEQQRAVLAVFNLSSTAQALALKNRPDLSDKTEWRDLLNDETLPGILPETSLLPYQFMWLVNARA